MVSKTKTKFKAEIKERIKRFKINKIPKYISKNQIKYYHSLCRYYNYLDKLELQNLNLGLVKGGDETYIFDIDDYTIPIAMFTTGKTYSKDDIDLFFKLSAKKFNLPISHGDLFLDIGANIGTTSIYVSKNINPHLDILAFEPDNLNYKLLIANSIINSCEGFKAEKFALSDKNDIADFLVCKENRGASRIVKNNNESMQENHRIQTIQFDDYIKESGIKDKIKYIWMDIEGHEPYALKGMKDFLTSHKLPLYMEFSSERLNDNEFRLLYDILSITYSGFYKVVNLNEYINCPLKVNTFKIDKLKNMFIKKIPLCNIMLF